MASCSSVDKKDRAALRRREWERRNQETLQEEEALTGSEHLFKEPYKTNRGDELSSRIQSTLGSYDEMKDILSNRSTQSRFVGIPAMSVPQTPSEKTEQSFFPDQRTAVMQPYQGSSGTGRSSGPSSASASSATASGSGSSAATGYGGPSFNLPSGSGSKKPGAERSRGSGGGGAGGGGGGHSSSSKSRHSSSHGYSHGDHRRGEHGGGVDARSKQQSISPAPTASSSHSGRHSYSRSSATGGEHHGGTRASATTSSAAVEQHHGRDRHRSKSPREPPEFSSNSPGPSSSSSASAAAAASSSQMSSQAFPSSLPVSSKQSSLQQKPTAYVRPMDGQDQQLSSDCSELPSSSGPAAVTGDVVYSSGPSAYGGAVPDPKGSAAAAKAKLTKITIPPQPLEAGNNNDGNCVEEILREMAYPWPSPLTAIQTPVTAKPSKFPFPGKDSQHVNTSFPGTKRGDASSKSATNTLADNSMLEDDLKLSSDESDVELFADKSVLNKAIIPVSVPVAESGDAPRSSAESGSSSESESSSESDSESETSSSDSEAQNQSVNAASPQPEPPPTNKWKLDNWLPKVNLNTNKSATPQADTGNAKVQGHEYPRGGDGGGGAGGSGVGGGGGGSGGAQDKERPSVAASQADAKEKLRSPARERGKGRSGQRHADSKSGGGRQKSPAQPDVLSQRRSIGRKQPKKLEKPAPSPEEPDYGYEPPKASPTVVESSGGGGGSGVAAVRRSVGRKQPKRTEKPLSPEDPEWPKPEYAFGVHKSPAQPEVSVQQQQQQQPQRRSVGRKQPRRIEKPASPDVENCPKSEFTVAQESSQKHKAGTGALSGTNHEQPKSKPKGGTGRKPAVKKETQPAPQCTAEAKKQRVPGKSMRKGREKVYSDTSSSSSSPSSDSESEPDESPAGKADSPAPSGAAKSSGSDAPCDSPQHSDEGAPGSAPPAPPAPQPPLLSRKEQILSPLHVAGGELLSPIHDYDEVRSLVVKIDLSLLARVPGRGETRGGGGQGQQQQPPSVSERAGSHRQQSTSRERSPPPPTTALGEKSKRKRQGDSEDIHSERKRGKVEKDATPHSAHKAAATKDDRKKIKVKTETPSHSSYKPPVNKESGKHTVDNKKKVAPPASPLSKSTAASERKRRNSESSTSSRVSTVSEAGKSSKKGNPAGGAAASQSSGKHRKLDGKTAGSAKMANREDSVADDRQVSEALFTKPGLCAVSPTLLRPRLVFDDKPQSVDFHMQEAKKLKHMADGMSDKLGKAINYTDAGLSFIECGNAMEQNPLEAKSPYTMYSETTDLVKYAMKLKSHSAPDSTPADKKLGVFSLRCLALLYLRMFKLKKDSAMKYSKSLLEHFKNASKMSQTPPWTGRGNGTPSPMSPTPSPAGSVGSQGSANTAAPSSSPVATVTIPQRIHQMAASHVNITNHFLYGYDHWEQAELLAKENHEFFRDLDQLMGALTLNSSMTELVRYTRQGLHWLRFEGQLL